MDVENKVLTVKELAKELRISESLAYKMVRSRQIYSLKVGDRYLVPRQALDRLLSGENAGMEAEAGSVGAEGGRALARRPHCPPH